MDEPQQHESQPRGEGPSIPGYRDFSRLGQGGFAVVYKAYQEQFDRVVAVKVLTIDLDERARLRFIRECQATGKLSAHPNVVTVLDAGVTNDGRPFMTTELMDRGSIADWIERNGPMPMADALQVGVKMCGALSVVHHAGILHRDVKPQNILVSAYGEPALSDFGISAVGMGTAGARATMTFTPEFTPPEILEGRPPEPAMDVYSLGATIYALLHGQPPFVSTDDEGLLPFIRRLMNDPIPPLPAEVAPPAVVDVLAKAMAKNIADRFPSADDFGVRLQELQASLGLPVTPMLTKADAAVVDPTAGIEALLRTAGTSSLATPTEATVVLGSRTGNGPWIAVAAVVLVIGLISAALLITRRTDATGGAGAGPRLNAGGSLPVPPRPGSRPGDVPPAAGPGAVSGAAPNPAAPTPGGVLRVALREELGDLKPGTNDASPSALAILTAIADPLVRVTDQGIQPAVAEAVAPNAEATTWTIKIRDGVKFSDGSVVDGSAVVDSMKLLRSNPKVAVFTQPIQKIEAADPKTVVVTLSSPWVAFPGALVQGLGLVVKKSDTLPIGSGPFKVKEGSKPTNVTLVRNDNYWGAKPFLDEIDFVVMASDDQRASALEKGEVDAVFTSDPNTLGRLGQKFPSVLQTDAIIDYVAFNTTVKPFDDQRVRDALAATLDRKILASALGESARTSSAAGVLAPLAASTGPPRAIDQVRARREIADLKRGGANLNFTLDEVVNSGAAKLGEALKKMWEGPNAKDALTVTIRGIDQKSLSTEQLSGKSQNSGGPAGAAVLASIAAPPDPDMLYPFLHSSSPLNLSKLNDPTIDQLLEAGRASLDPEARKVAYTTLAARLNDTNGYVFLVTEPYALVLSSKVTGITAAMSAELIRGGAVPWASHLGIVH